ncbi:MAG: TraB/GumN family protein [Proteobacteria bacterium]|nr:TraB/GumN family protein [Pseudomonadota bacterium]MBU0966565.1 TraB/GumN family protein [Pseudomonadota bacterium]
MKISPRRLLSAINLWLLLILLFTTPVQAKNTLWQVRSGEHTLYLLGSLHVLKKGDYPLPPLMEEIYVASDAVVFETDMDEMDTPAIQKKIITYGRVPTGQTLQQQLSPRTWQLLQQKMAMLKIPVEKVQQMKPWLCALTLTVTDLERLGFLAQYGLDEHFYAMAKKDKKKIIPLESVNFQLSLFYSQSRQEQEEFLLQTLNDLQMTDALSGEMETAWKSGDGEKLYSLIAKSFADYPKQFKRLVLQRNKNWLPVLEKILKREPVTLVVVGAGHLVGPDSVVDLLRRRGYLVVQR